MIKMARILLISGNRNGNLKLLTHSRNQILGNGKQDFPNVVIWCQTNEILGNQNGHFSIHFWYDVIKQRSLSIGKVNGNLN